MEKSNAQEASPVPNESSSHESRHSYVNIQERGVTQTNATPSGSSDQGDQLPPPKVDFMAPPAYDVATALPSYEEVQHQKSLENEQQRFKAANGLHQPLHFFSIEMDSLNDQDTQLGSDFMFFVCFFLAFLFNWIGLLVLLCFCHTLAGRYGTLAGFGVSLIKCSLIVRNTELLSSDMSWICWIFITVGILISCRAFFQYVRIKREWQNLSTDERMRFYSVF